MNFIKTHKKAMLAVLACVILMILAMVAIYRMFYPNSSKSEYGNRTQNAPAIDSAIVEKVKEKLIDTDKVNTVSYSLTGPTMKFFIDTKKDTKVEDAQALTTIIMNEFSTSITEYYDMEVYITQKGNEEASSYPMIGYHSKASTKFTFVVNKAGDKNEE